MSTTSLVIALLAPASSVHAIRWANAFVRGGHEVHLITQHEPLPGLDAEVVLHRLPHWAGLGYLFNGLRLKRLLNLLRPDVVNAHYATGYGTLARNVGKVPLVLNVWGSDVYDFPRRGPIHRWWLGGNLRRADLLVSTSGAMADHTRTLYPGLARPIVVPFGVNTELFKPGDPKAGVEAALVLGTVKSLAPVYGIDRLMQAFAQLLKMDVPADLRLRIVGDGPQRKELERLAGELGITDRTDLVEAVPHAQVPEELRKLSVYVALSRSESFGVTVLEASACGVPTVVSDAGGLPEVVRDGVTGYVVADGDPQLAAQQIHQLLSAPALRERLGAAGRRLVQELYEESLCVDRMTAVLQQASRPWTP